MSDIWLILIFIVPIALILLLRVNAVLVYLGLCLGYVLSEFVTNTKLASKIPDYDTVRKISHSSDSHLLLLVLPPLVIMLTMFKTAHKKKLLSINTLGAIATGALSVILVVPRLPYNTAVSITNSSLWADIAKNEGIIVVATSLIILLFLISQRKKLVPHSKEDKHHKSKS